MNRVVLHCCKMYKHNLFLDLDNTLVYVVGEKDRFVVNARPQLVKFLEFCAKYFYLNIWSAGEKSHVENIAELLTKRCKVDFVNVLSRDDCTKIVDEKNEVRYIKNFCEAWNSQGYLPENCVLLDDNIEHADQNPQNVLLIKSWYGEDDDRCLDEAMYALAKIALCKDVQSMIVDFQRRLREKDRGGYAIIGQTITFQIDLITS